jgi:hypothetical protein
MISPPSPCQGLASMYKVLKHDPFNYKHCSLHSTECDSLKTPPIGNVYNVEMCHRSQSMEKGEKT